MILGELGLLEAMRLGAIEIRGLDASTIEESVEPASVDLHLSNEWLVPVPNHYGGNRLMMDLSKPMDYEHESGNLLCIPPHGFRLASTIEEIFLSKDYAAYVEGRSSIGRAGLAIENAGWIDPGFEGTITLELFNMLSTPIIIPVGIRICQIVVAMVHGGTSYKGKYQCQSGATGSQVWQDCLNPIGGVSGK